MVLVPSAMAALTGVPAAHTGVASAFLNVSLQIGGALGLAVLSTIATSRTGGRTDPGPLVEGFVLAFVAAAVLLVLTAVVALALFREEGRGQQVNVVELQKAELDPGE